MIEHVQGTIIGPDRHGTEQPYAFHSTGGEPITSGWFPDDAAAEAWFKQAFPTAYAQGVEMRTWDNW
ncbi:MAG: hypothetical protein KKB13_18885 [Chloroflexi bacterium]|nr:hypothetical protein [Chloroflexota bacterium]